VIRVPGPQADRIRAEHERILGEFAVAGRQLGRALRAEVGQHLDVRGSNASRRSESVFVSFSWRCPPRTT
jgi:hypothetical protein